MEPQLDETLESICPLRGRLILNTTLCVRETLQEHLELRCPSRSLEGRGAGSYGRRMSTTRTQTWGARVGT